MRRPRLSRLVAQAPQEGVVGKVHEKAAVSNPAACLAGGLEASPWRKRPIPSHQETALKRHGGRAMDQMTPSWNGKPGGFPNKSK